MDQYMPNSTSCGISDAHYCMPAHWQLPFPELAWTIRLVFAPVSAESYAYRFFTAAISFWVYAKTVSTMQVALLDMHARLTAGFRARENCCQEGLAGCPCAYQQPSVCQAAVRFSACLSGQGRVCLSWWPGNQNNALSHTCLSTVRQDHSSAAHSAKYAEMMQLQCCPTFSTVKCSPCVCLLLVQSDLTCVVPAKSTSFG